MIRTIKKYKLTSHILVLFYLNFYFLSPFIHEHPVEIEGQIESKNVPHSHLASIVNPISNDAGYVSSAATSHSHNFAFDIPIIIQPTQEFNNIFSSYIVFQNDEYTQDLEIKFNILISTKLHDQVLWERYVQFATNNSPPLFQSIQLS
ncbi:MAG: hypothetical protein KAI45_01465 [Melioribacteraceae bacterium]|nr:hypothetical protein [Melioribacteraceae bacterium]